MTKRNLMQTRKKMCFDIADDVLDLIGTSPVAPEEIAKIIELRLPLSYAEAEEEMKVIMDDDEQPKKAGLAKSAIDRLRAALGLGDEHSLVQVIKSACERLEKS